MGNRTLVSAPWIAGLVLATLASPAAAEELLVFDLADESAIVEEHTAHLLWNLNTDNLTNPSTTGWNSMYLTIDGEPSGQISIDLEAGRATGQIVERWQCEGDCTASDGSPSYANTLNTGWTATLSEVALEPDGPGWSIEGKVNIEYFAHVTSIETPSICGEEECYICDRRLCKIDEKMTATADLEGWLEGDTLSLAFEDRLAPNAHDMELAHLRRTQFIMGRFSMTTTAVPTVVAEVPPPPPDQPPPPAETPDEQEGTADDPKDTADDATEPVDDAAAPPVDQQPDTADDPDAEQSAAGEPADEDDGGLAFDAITILVLILLGAIGFVTLVKPDWVIPRKSRKRDPRLPPPSPPELPPDPSRKTYVVGEKELTYQTTVEAVPPPPTYVIVNPADSSGSISGSDKLGQVHTVQSGREIEVVKRAGDLVQVRVPDTSPFWVHKKHVQVKARRRT